MRTEILTIDLNKGKRLFMICGNYLAVNVPEKQQDEYLKTLQTGQIFRKKNTAVYKLNNSFSMYFDHESNCVGFSDGKKNLVLHEIIGSGAKLIWNWTSLHLFQLGYRPVERKRSAWAVLRQAVIFTLVIAGLLAFLLWVNTDQSPLSEMRLKSRALVGFTRLLGPTGLYILAGLGVIGTIIYSVRLAMKGWWQTVYRKESRPANIKRH